MTDRDLRFSISIPRRWFQFSMRTLLGLMVVAAVVAACLAWWWRSPVILEGYCPITLNAESRWVKGDRRFSAVYEGRRYHFAGPEELERFEKSPDRYGVILAGSDVVLMMDEGRSVAGIRRHGLEYNGQIFLFENEETLQRFSRNPRKYAIFAHEWSSR